MLKGYLTYKYGLWLYKIIVLSKIFMNLRISIKVINNRQYVSMWIKLYSFFLFFYLYLISFTLQCAICYTINDSTIIYSIL